MTSLMALVNACRMECAFYDPGKRVLYAIVNRPLSPCLSFLIYNTLT